MSVIAAAVITSAATGIYAANKQAKAAKNAANQQNITNNLSLEESQRQFDATMAFNKEQAAASLALQRSIAGMQIGESRRQFNMVRATLAPFINAGNEALGQLKPYQQAGQDALQGQRALIGLNGADAQQQAIAGLSSSPEMLAYIQQGENAMMQNAAATGGLRGGNTQAAMAQFRPSLLAGMINQQYERLGGLTSLGANTTSMVYQTGASAAAGQANAGMQVAAQVGNALGNYAQGAGATYARLMGAGNAAYGNLGNATSNYYANQGSINAGNALAQGAASAQMANAVGGAFGSYAMLQALKGGGLNSNPNTAGLASLGAGMPAANYGLSTGNAFNTVKF